MDLGIKDWHFCLITWWATLWVWALRISFWCVIPLLPFPCSFPLAWGTWWFLGSVGPRVKANVFILLKELKSLCVPLPSTFRSSQVRLWSRMWQALQTVLWYEVPGGCFRPALLLLVPLWFSVSSCPSGSVCWGPVEAETSKSQQTLNSPASGHAVSWEYRCPPRRMYSYMSCTFGFPGW